MKYQIVETSSGLKIVTMIDPMSIEFPAPITLEKSMFGISVDNQRPCYFPTGTQVIDISSVVDIGDFPYDEYRELFKDKDYRQDHPVIMTNEDGYVFLLSGSSYDAYSKISEDAIGTVGASMPILECVPVGEYSVIKCPRDDMRCIILNESPSGDDAINKMMKEFMGEHMLSLCISKCEGGYEADMDLSSWKGISLAKNKFTFWYNHQINLDGHGTKYAVRTDKLRIPDGFDDEKLLVKLKGILVVEE